MSAAPMPWSEAEEARRIAHGLTPWGAPDGPSPELIEVLANAIYACDREPPLNARTVPDRWAVYQRQALNIVWPKLREHAAPASLRAELAEAKAEIARLEKLADRNTHTLDARSARIYQMERIVEAATALARTWQQTIADGFNQVDLTMPLNLLVAAVEEGARTDG